MPFPEFDPVLFSIGPLDIRWYALAYVAGIVLGWWYAARLIKNTAIWAPGKPPISTPQLDDLILWITLGIILGGRFGYALFYKPELYGHLFTGASWGERLGLFRLWDGGMSFHGGMIGTTLAVLIFAWRTKLRTLSIGDMALAAAPFGLFFGRMANFINGELWGRETTVPWGVNFCSNRAREAYGATCNFFQNGSWIGPGDVVRHPSQLYEAGLEGIALFVILWLAVYKWRLLAKPGYVTGIFLFGYGLARASLENFRQPDAGLENLPLGLTMGMFLSIPMMLIGAWLIWRAWNRPPVAA
ncbi:prolipoprotein diacylglyceryl transferase [Brevundimonas sp.]|uniref:prolipoprotein diacylglyceryl transferase n=1 Tax=Brevundimonas sp. TaxID=1871086 RepID=UPI00272FF466|nr:prolipoprotein diacylglyceryl transferase [Brevundimonas sp.]MDP1913464.1 prolipoprotein diacylglyceryl transferase [Brevundimonas sp.]